jgi:hypothetical protein
MRGCRHKDTDMQEGKRHLKVLKLIQEVQYWSKAENRMRNGPGPEVAKRYWLATC